MKYIPGKVVKFDRSESLYRTLVFQITFLNKIANLLWSIANKKIDMFSQK